MSNNKSLSICFLVIICLGTFSGCSKPKTSYDYLNLARQEHQKGDDQAALIDLKNALKKDPKNGEARLLIAQIYNERGEGPAAEIELRKAIDLGIDKSYVAVAMGKALFLQRQFQKVLDTINVAAGDKGKVAADIYNVRGDAYIALNKSTEAKTAFEAALKEYPDSVDAKLGLARLAAIKNDFDSAFHQVELILSKEPDNLKALYLRANLARVQKHEEVARSTFKHILRVDQRNIYAYLSLAAMDIEADKFDAAKTEIDAALKISPKDLASLFTLATLQIKRGEYQAAQDSVQEVLKAAPNYLPGVQLRGVVAYAQGSYEQALHDLNQVIAKYPGNANARRLVAATHLKLGEIGPAMEALKPLLKPGVGDAEALALAGEAQLKAKNYDLSTLYLQQAVKLNPAQVSQLRTQLALSRLGAGNTEQAISDLMEAASQSPGKSTADSILITIHLRRKEYDQALTAIDNLEKKLGPNPVTYNLRGLALVGKQDFAGARQAFEKSLALQPTDFQAAANLAQLDMRDHNPDAARKRFESILDKDKSNVQAMLALADLAAVQKQDQDYVHWLDKVIKTKPDAILPRIKLADFYITKKDNASALKVANDAIKAFPNSPEALGLLGTIQLAAGDKESALISDANLVEQVPNSPAAHLQLGLAQLVANKLTEARASLNKALELRPDFPQALDALQQLDLAENNGDDALKISRNIQKQQPKSPEGFDREADILMARKQYMPAVKAYEQALARGAGSEEMIKLHRALIMAGDRKSAEQRLSSWIKKNPNDVIVRSYAGFYYMNSNRNHDAIVQYEALQKLAPQNAVTLNNLATLYQREKDNRALPTAEQALKLAPENPGILDTLGWILVGQKQNSRAVKLLREAAANAPKAAVIHYHLAVALARSGQKVEAKKEVEAAINSGEKFPELGDAKAMLKGL